MPDSEERCRDREHRDAVRVKADGARDDGDREQVYVLAHEVLEGVLVDGILDAVSRDVLLVMVLVDPGIPAWLAQAMRARARATGHRTGRATLVRNGLGTLEVKKIQEAGWWWREERSAAMLAHGECIQAGGWPELSPSLCGGGRLSLSLPESESESESE